VGSTAGGAGELAKDAEGALQDRIKAMNDLANACKLKDDAKIKDAVKRLEAADAVLGKAAKDEVAKALAKSKTAWEAAQLGLWWADAQGGKFALAPWGGVNIDHAFQARIKAMYELAAAYKSKDDAKIKEAEQHVVNVDLSMVKLSKDEATKLIFNNVDAWTKAALNLAMEAFMSGKAFPPAMLKPAWAPGP
jgi:hypothetical protein